MTAIGVRCSGVGAVMREPAVELRELLRKARDVAQSRTNIGDQRIDRVNLRMQRREIELRLSALTEVRCILSIRSVGTSIGNGQASLGARSKLDRAETGFTG